MRSSQDHGRQAPDQHQGRQGQTDQKQQTRQGGQARQSQARCRIAQNKLLKSPPPGGEIEPHGELLLHLAGFGGHHQGLGNPEVTPQT